MLLEIVLGGTLVLFIAWILFKKPAGLPPGKWGLPLIGHIPFDGKYIDDQLKDFKTKYGDVYIWRFGNQLQVFVHDYNICRQMFSHADFIDRPNLEVLKSNSGDALGVAGSNGAIWHSNRRFSLRQLRDLGMGKSRLVFAVQEQASTLLEVLKRDAGKETNISMDLNTAIVNVIWKMVADTQFKSDDPRIRDLQEVTIIMNETFPYAVIAEMFSWLQYFIPKSMFKKFFKLDTFNNAEAKYMVYFDELIKEHEENLDSNEPKDLIDAYLIEMRQKNDELEGLRNYEDLKFLLFDLFLAGSDTTTDTTTWLILYLAAFPDKQRKFQDEIDRVLPKNELATLEYRTSMPYTEALINEALRKSTIVNIGVQHAATQDTTLAGYKIPKGTMVTSASHCIHHDERYWDQPDRFLPERWIGPDGKFVMKKEGFLPFGTGKRSCIGEGMARMEVFVLATAIFQSFNVAPPEGKQIDLVPDDKTFVGHKARQQDVVFTLRS